MALANVGRALTVALLAACLAVGGLNLSTTHALRASLAAPSLETMTMTVYETSWMSGAQRYQVTTTCGSEETAPVCAQRFADAVAALQQIYPPNP